MEYSRPASAFRFKMLGVKTNAPPDALAEYKSPYAQNTRPYTTDELQTRPPLAQITADITTNKRTLALEPTLGVRKLNDGQLYTGSTILDTGYSTTSGSSLTPFRPNQSPNAYEYVWDAAKQSKVYIPSSGSPVVQKIGIAEPQAPVDFGIGNSFFTPINVAGGVSYGHAGTAGFITDTVRNADVVAAVFQDPVIPSGALPEYTVQTTSSSQSYSVGQFLSIGTADVDIYQVKDVYPALVGSVTIAGIYYHSGTTGLCTVVPFNIGAVDNDGLSLLQSNLLTGIRRGALVTLNATGGIGTNRETCYVLGTAIGPDGTISFDVVTVNTHIAGEVLGGAPAIKVLLSSAYNGVTPTAPVPTAVISAHYAAYGVGGGIGTQSSPISYPNPFSYGSVSYRPDDYIHIAIISDAYELVNEVKLLLDVSVSPGAFTDYYFATIRPSDIQAGLANTLTQLGVAQLSAQRDTIDEEASTHGQTASSTTANPGDNTWSDIFIPLSQFTRVGGDQTRALININYFQVLVNAASGLNFGFHTVDICGGFSPDISKTGMGMEYVIRPRSSVTGAKGNPSPRPRYLVYPRREEVKVILPTSYSDPQMDTWDIYRRGASIEKFTLIGSVPLAIGYFLDNYTDLAILNNPQIEYNQFEPFPSIGPPITGTANVIGYEMVATLPLAASSPAAAGTLKQIGSLLPGNLVQVGQQNYTLYCRPTAISTGASQIWLFQLVENAGVQSSVAININEPALANQINAAVWGPDANGTFFAVQDPLRPGVISTTNPNNPDSTTEGKDVSDLCPPSEPLMNGFLISATSIVFSAHRAWRGYPQQGGSYAWNEIPVGRGLAATWGVCTDGKIGYYVAIDGIRKTAGGEGVSITDEDLYNLFPHDGVPGVNVAYNGNTFYAPSYAYADSMRLAVVNGFLYFDYLDGTATQRTLVMHIASGAWLGADVYTPAISIHAGTTSPGETGGVVNQQLFFGSINGGVFSESTSRSFESVAAIVCMREEVFGDIRATKLFGDASVDCLFASTMTIVPVVLGVAQSALTNTFAASARLDIPPALNLGGEFRSRMLGMQFSWTDTSGTTILYSLQLSYLTQPEDTAGRFTDWDSAGTLKAKWFEGFTLMADTSSTNKGITVRNGDTLAAQTFYSNLGSNVVNHNGQQTKSYVFNPPFIAHLVRFEPDEVSWRNFKIEWITQPTPETGLQWTTQPTTHGFTAYQHVRQMRLSYSAPQPVSFVLTVDGVATGPYTLPATSGGFAKTIINLGAWKGLVFTYSLTSAAEFAVWSNGIEVLVKEWGSSGPYRNVPLIGTEMGEKSEI